MIFGWTVFIICMFVAGHNPLVLLACWFGGAFVLLLLLKGTQDINPNRIKRWG